MSHNPDAAQWQLANSQDLTARLQRIRAWLNQALNKPDDSPDLPLSSPFPTSISILAGLFNLSEFETETLLLCAGVEMDSALAALCAEMNGDSRRTAPTFGLALTVLPGAHWSALSPDSPLRYWRLLELSLGEGLAHAPLRIDERILHFLAGLGGFDERLKALIYPVHTPGSLDDGEYSQETQRLHSLLGRSETVTVQVSGADSFTRLSHIGAAVEQSGLRLFRLRAADIPSDPRERLDLVRLWRREALLAGGCLVIETQGSVQENSLAAALITADDFTAIISSDDPVHLPVSRQLLGIQLGKPRPAAQRKAWQKALASQGISANGYIAELAAQFRLSSQVIQTIAQDALAGQGQNATPLETRQRLWEASRRQARQSLDDLAQRIETRHTWQDIVLPEAQMELLYGIPAHVAQRYQVYETWGFGMHARGSGTSVIFAGASGTGKTLAAEIIANELHLDLYRVDLSGVVSKYIGETEKNLRRIFSAAEYGGAILLFDEADALFGKRSEVRDSHDRYANIEVSYLLQQMETYSGLAILTTNMLENFDRAFLRRVRFVVQFPFPTAEERAEIWQRVFPAEAPTRGLDYYKLARLNITGGSIRNIALNSAFLAADAGEPVTMPHILGAAKIEYAKLEKPLPDLEMRDWEQIHE